VRYLFGFVCVCALGVVPLVGCSDESGTAGSGGTGGTGGVDTVARIIVIRGYSPYTGFSGVLEGAEICETDTDHCVLTDAAGRATVQVPIGREFSFTVEKEGFAPFLLPDFIPADSIPADPELFRFLGVGEYERIAHQHELVMSPYPMEGTGSINIPFDNMFSTLSTGCVGVAGITLDLGYAAGKVYYYDEQANWRADLSATSCWGYAGFTEVPPGEVQIEIGGNAENCVVVSGWPGEVENSVRTPIRAGYVSWLHLSCDVPE
jgi:hypothetical protein